MKRIWFQYGPYGGKIFLNATTEYHKIHGVFPRTNDQLPEFLTSLGYPCEADYTTVFDTIDGEDRLVEAKGLKMDDETATALILKFGL